MTDHSTAPGLLLVAHGSSDPAATATAMALADTIRRARPALTVAVGFLDHAQPAAARALELFGESSVVVVPLLLTDAFHAQTDVNGLVEHARATGQTVIAGDVVGSDTQLELAALDLLDELGADPSTQVVLVSAGTSNADARTATEAVAKSIAKRRGGPVRVAYLSAAHPTLDEALAIPCPAGQARVVLCWLLFPGRFADLAAAAAVRAGIRSTRLIGAHPRLVDLVLARYDSAVTNAS